MSDALEHCFGAVKARAGSVYAMRGGPEMLAANGIIGPGASSPGLQTALADIAERAISTRQTFKLTDVRSDRQDIRNAGEIAGIGCTGAVSVPILRNRNAVGALVLLFAAQDKIDDASVVFLETIAALFSDLVPAESGDDAPASAHMKPNRSSTTGIVLLGASVAHQLEGPVSALDLQLEEQRRLLSELRMLTDDGDTALGGTTAELAELTD